MRTFLWAAAIAMAATMGLAGAENPDATYAALAKKAAAGDPVDFRALRMACAAASRCDARGDRTMLQEMRQASREGNHKKTAALASKLIAAGFPQIEAHMASAQAYEAMQKPAEAERHKAIAGGLLRSILQAGDGKTKETAFEVIGTHEEHLTLSVMGLQFGGQSLIPGKPHSYDVIEAKNPKTGETVRVYFQIDAFYPMKGLR
ncbi:MAG TPA: DUF4919 domain-containing protein [Bryobacteraceae bacterium]|nr:DUF4919 domain-containing protein [Bryobacteraceae bacterium]